MTHCEECGQELPVVIRRHGRPKRFCSVGCRQKWRYRIDHPKQPICCPICGKQFVRQGQGPHRYCSIECKQVTVRRRYDRLRKPKAAERSCALCGATFQPECNTQLYCKNHGDVRTDARRRNRAAYLALRALGVKL